MSVITAAIALAARDFPTIFLRVRSHMGALDEFLKEQLSSFEPEIREMADYCIDTSGKRIRPALVFFSGWRESAPPSPALVQVAAVVELVHLATLVHDDIMDKAETRRSRPAAAHKYGSAAAVLLGDALFAHALHLAARFPTTEVCEEVSESTRRVCAGEIVQTLRRRSLAVTRDDYYRVIDLKTAELFRVSCRLGARLGEYSEEFAESAAHFGRHLGIAYQIYDDLADFFGRENQIGKTLGTDLASGKLTLPLFELRDRLSPEERLVLEDELRGLTPACFEERRREMEEMGVFDAVAEAIEGELRRAEARLAGHADLAPVTNLLALTDVLRGQVEKLRP